MSNNNNVINNINNQNYKHNHIFMSL